jgi:FKBP-type peptidyl-prolyl cis-trans isomerase (trigger factor)
LPQSEVQRQTSNEVYDMVQYNTSRGLPREAIEENREQIFSAAAKSAEDRLKLRYILLKIAAKENFTVTDTEIDQHIRHLAQRSHKDPAKVKADFKKNDVMDDVRDDLLVDKAMKMLLDLQQPTAAVAG